MSRRKQQLTEYYELQVSHTMVLYMGSCEGVVAIGRVVVRGGVVAIGR